MAVLVGTLPIALIAAMLGHHRLAALATQQSALAPQWASNDRERKQNWKNSGLHTTNMVARAP
jgi:hypothetical protein